MATTTRLLTQVRQVVASQVAQVVGQGRQEVLFAGYVLGEQEVQVTPVPLPAQTAQLGTTLVQSTQAVPAAFSTIWGEVLQTQLAPEGTKVVWQVVQVDEEQALQLG